MVEDLIEALEASKIESNPPSPLVFDRPFSQTRDVCAEKRRNMNSLFFSPLAAFLLAVLHLTLKTKALMIETDHKRKIETVCFM